MFMTAEQLITRLSQLAPDTPVVGFVGAPDSLEGAYGFIPTQSDWQKVVEAFATYSVDGFDQVWDAFADAKMDVLGDFLCCSCDSYSYTCKEDEDGSPTCADCFDSELDNNAISN